MPTNLLLTTIGALLNGAVSEGCSFFGCPMITACLFITQMVNVCGG